MRPVDSAERRVTIRRIGPTDWAAFRVLRLRALATDPWAFGSTLPREQGFTEKEWRERISRDAPSSLSATWVAADPEERYVGMVASARIEGTFHIFAMWVEPERRGEGIAGRLLDASLAWVSGIAPGSEVQLQVNPRAAAAVRLYSSRGFRATGRSEPLHHTPGEKVEEMIRPG